MRVPTATYRLQLTDDFTLHDARAAVDYVAALGVTDLYLSPVFQARSGSTHGYDVTDPTRIRASLGGETALHALAEAARAASLGILLDIVPNHMAASVENPWWRDVLCRGRSSPYAHYFDIDWENPEGLLLPILGDSPERVIGQGQLRLDAGTRELVYFETRLPLAPHTSQVDSTTDVTTVLEQQHYRLVHWRTASERMTYRRFFDVTDLVGMRVEDPVVFDATHTLVRDLAAAGVITGLRIDHIDGLRDPAGYLERLRGEVRDPHGEPLYTVVEKILEREERLPADWQCEGTTGYEFLNLATGLLLEPDGYFRMGAFHRRITGDEREFGDVVRDKKLLVMRRLFDGELTALAERLGSLLGCSIDEARNAVRAVTASMGVYRTYTRSTQVRPEDRRRIDEAVDDAIRRAASDPAAGAPSVDSIRALQRVLLLEAGEPTMALEWVLRWQQFTGPVMAKGFEDTALYCHNVLLAANEVGSDPERPCLTGQELQRAIAGRLVDHGRSLNATATHDTKRGEDTRARIAVLSELPDEWRNRLRRWMRQGEEWKAELVEDEDSVVVDADVDSLLYQTLLGAWPLEAVDAAFSERIQLYLMKAVREAKEYTSWRRPDEDFEEGLSTFVAELMGAVGRAGLPEDLEAFARRLAPHGALNSLSQLLLKILAPGIPDIYQGTELWSFTLVDPDNRRAVDYDARRRALTDLERLIDQPDAAGVSELLATWTDGRIKLFITGAALRCRLRHAAAVAAPVVSLEARGEGAAHVIGFARAHGSAVIAVAVPRWTTRLTSAAPRIDPTIWLDTSLTLPPAPHGSWRNVLTGECIEGTDVPLSHLFATIPYALLEPRS